MDMDLDPR